ncbi:DUF3696 domain-containing protein [Desulfobacterales bacterium HSG2]|nr:DUF3696 domain-containing protein [Desulfobacterales bacterium HSG2]
MPDLSGKMMQDYLTEVTQPFIDADGRLDEWPGGFLDEWDNNLKKLVDF